MRRLEGRRAHKNEEVEVVLRECLRTQESGRYCHKTFQILLFWENRVRV